MRCREHLRFALTSPPDSASSLSNGCTSNCATTRFDQHPVAVPCALPANRYPEISAGS
jgi:hypothetical protein